jgi:hypothetical protein
MLFSNMIIKNGRVCSKDESRDILYQGIPIHIEQDIGDIREHKNGQTTFYVPYGFIKNTVGIDKEEIDCFIGPNPYASNVYIIKLAKADKEEKTFLGFNTKEEAVLCFLAHYSNQDFLGETTELSMQFFKSILYD